MVGLRFEPRSYYRRNLQWNLNHPLWGTKENLVNRFFAALLLMLSAVAFAQSPQIKSGAAVFIEPMGGYETYLAAAIVRKHVPVDVVADRSKADYIITSNVSHRTPSQPKVVVNDNSVNKNAVNSTNVNNSNNDAWNQGSELGRQIAAERRAAHAALGATSASISVMDAQSSQIVFAYAVGKAGSRNQIQSTADACAKHLKEFIDKSGKRTTAAQSPSLPVPVAPLPSPLPLPSGNSTLSGQSIETLKERAASGDAGAQFELGAAYFSGQGAPPDYAIAASWFRKAAEQGDAGAEYGLGGLYSEGAGVPKDYATAASWYRKAAEQGNDGAQMELGEAYSDGQGVPKDYAQAAVWWRKAAEQGNADAQSELGHSYSVGQGVPQDYAQAAVWWRKAAEQGDAKAQAALGVAYSDGNGVPQDYAEYYFWLDIAAAGNLAGKKQGAVVELKKDAAAHLSKEILLQTQVRARKWFEDHGTKP
jgi:hypothetical protein